MTRSFRKRSFRKRSFVAAAVCLLGWGLGAPALGVVPVASAATSAPAVPKVVFIVGPSGAATDRYRAESRAAAKLARRYTPDVTELYSPDATWPAVRRALAGASLVVYMGHGNGWPSRYRDHLYRPTQNGFGLNPQAGGGDQAHQYFGEARIAADIRLADDAVVLLHHLCYASGLSEPGLPEGSAEDARRRVDNFAAGFIAAGAAAVAAEAYAGPQHMIRSILGTGRAIEPAWRAAPSGNGRVVAFESVRSPGHVALMDTERTGAGFTRSLVVRAGLAATDVLRGARGSAGGGTPDRSPAPSLAAAGLTAMMPVLSATAAGSTVQMTVPYTVERRRALPKTLLVAVRWDPLDPAPRDPTLTATEAGAATVISAAVAATRTAAPDIGIVAAERLGDVVAPVPLSRSADAFAVEIATPPARGRYRLTVTLHDADGVAYDAASQALLPTLIVRVTGDLDALISGPALVDLAPGEGARVPLWIANTGTVTWGHAAFTDPISPDGTVSDVAARVTGQWLALGAADDPARRDAATAAAAASVTPAALPPGFAPGAGVATDLQLFAPTLPGAYLLLLDVVTPEHGSLVANGVEPTIVRVDVAVAAP